MNPMDNNNPTAYSFMQTELLVSGDNFISDTSNMVFRLTNGVFSKEFNPEQLSYRFTKKNEFAITLPSAFELNVPYELSFPHKMSFGVSFNGGESFEYIDIIYQEKQNKPIIISVNPNLIPRLERKITLTGARFDNETYCVFKTPSGIEIKNVTSVFINQQTITCEMPRMDEHLKKVLLSVINSFGDESDAKEITLYSIPIIELFSPVSAPTNGGGLSLTIYGKNFETDISRISCKFNSIIKLYCCNVESSTKMICESTSS